MDKLARCSDLSYVAPLIRYRVREGLVECHEQGLEVDIFETLRTMERQTFLYAQGRTRPGAIITKAKPGDSLHHYGLAVDWAFRVEGKWSWDASLAYDKVVAIFVNLGFETLSFEKAHVQMSGGLTLKEIKRIALKKGNEGLWADLGLL